MFSKCCNNKRASHVISVHEGKHAKNDKCWKIGPTHAHTKRHMWISLRRPMHGKINSCNMKLLNYVRVKSDCVTVCSYMHVQHGLISFKLLGASKTTDNSSLAWQKSFEWVSLHINFTSGFRLTHGISKRRKTADIETATFCDGWKNRWTSKQVRIQLTFNQTLVRYDPSTSTINFPKKLNDVKRKRQRPKRIHWSTSKHAISFDQISVIKAKSFLVWSGSPCHKLNVIQHKVVLRLNFFSFWSWTWSWSKIFQQFVSNLA